MPRPIKCRKVCCLPQNDGFIPTRRCNNNAETIYITVDEYETVRLLDEQGLSQEECGNYMKVARTTVQMIYNNARKKIAHALVNGLAIKIEGGDYRVCDGKEDLCECGGCLKHRNNLKKAGDGK